MAFEWQVGSIAGERQLGGGRDETTPGPTGRVRLGVFAHMAMGASEGIEPWSSRLPGHFHPFFHLLRGEPAVGAKVRSKEATSEARCPHQATLIFHTGCGS